jgi:septal ring factor EnvC (AmiA/AmiB activator)
MKRIGAALVVLLLVAGWLAFWFWPPDDTERAKRLESEIRALELERTQVAADSLKRQIDNAVTAQALAGASDTLRLLAETERAARELNAEYLKAISRMRAELARPRP